ncbi:MAG: tetratricopeptide repeat protein [Bacteroidota bacterium]
MNKKFTYLILLFVFFGLTAFVVIRYTGNRNEKKLTDYPLKKREGAMAQLPEWATVKEAGDKLYRQVREQPSDVKSKLALSSLYIQEGRATGNYNYYNEAAMKYIDDVLVLQPQSFEALSLKASIQLSQHHFAEALQTAAAAQKINPYNAFIYGVTIDGNVEMGNYTAAVEASDKMMSIRPDIRSYSRVAYLREIHGDVPGAIEAMQMAVDAGGYGDEPSAWARIQLARLYQTAGNLKAAEMHYTIAQTQRPGYPYAAEGLAHIAVANKDYTNAEKLFQQAIATSPDYALKEELAKFYLSRNQNEKAGKLLDEIITELTASTAQDEQSTNHHAGKDLAYIYLLKNDVTNAEKYVMAEYNTRPDNIDVNAAVAWVLYKKGDAKAALPYLDKALITGMKDATVLNHAVVIYQQAGETEKAKNITAKLVTNYPAPALSNK